MDLKKHFYKRGPWIVIGSALIVLSLAIAVLTIWEVLGRANTRFHALELPGFHSLELKTPGLYAGVYQHNRPGPIPSADLSRLSVRVMSSDSFQEVPLVSNTSGRTFSQFGLSGMPLFNFVIEHPGSYTLSAVYPGEPGPHVNVLLMSQAVRDIKPTLMVGGIFFILFLVLGIWIIVKSKNWAVLI